MIIDFALILATTGLSFVALVALRVCAIGKCYTHLPIKAAEAMFLCCQITNLLLVLSTMTIPIEY